MGRLCTGVVLLLAVSAAAAQSFSARRMPFQQLLHKTVNGAMPATSNVVFSPSSVATALTLLREAAGGASRREIEAALGRNHRQAPQESVSLPGVTLRLFSAFYHDQQLPVRRAYVRAVQRLGAQVVPQPLTSRPAAAVAAINADVARATEGKIRDLVQGGDRQLVAVLVSAIYFRAEWRRAFDPRETRPGAFTAADGRQQTVSMMSSTDQYLYLRNDAERYASVALPYKDERFKMVIVLPDQEANLNDLINRVDVNLMYKQMREQRVIVKFPKFKVETKLPLTDILRNLGIREVFTSAANLRRMSSDPRLYVSSAHHRAVIETDEQGSEAAAATSIMISARSFFSQGPPSLIANRPFLFFVYDVSTANVLFSGQIADAAAAQGAQPAAVPSAAPSPVPAPVLIPASVPALASVPAPASVPVPATAPTGTARMGQAARAAGRASWQGQPTQTTWRRQQTGKTSRQPAQTNRQPAQTTWQPAQTTWQGGWQPTRTSWQAAQTAPSGWEASQRSGLQGRRAGRRGGRRRLNRPKYLAAQPEGDSSIVFPVSRRRGGVGPRRGFVPRRRPLPQQATAPSGTGWTPQQGTAPSGAGWTPQQGTAPSGAGWDQQGTASSGAGWGQQAGQGAVPVRKGTAVSHRRSRTQYPWWHARRQGASAWQQPERDDSK